ISTIVAFPTGFELRVFILRPAPEGEEIADPTWRGRGREPRREFFQLGVELSDGRRGTNLDPWPEGDEAPSAPHVRSMIGVTGPPRASAGAAGCTLLRITFPKPLGRYAPKIVVRAEQPDVFMADRNKNVATILRAVAGGNGKPLVEGPSSRCRTRTASG